MNSASLCNSRPRAPEAHYELGLLLRQRGELDAAAAEFRKAIDLSPTDGPSLLNLAQILGLQGKTEESQQAIRKFEELRKDRDTLRTVQLYTDTGIRLVEPGRPERRDRVFPGCGGAEPGFFRRAPQFGSGPVPG